MTTTPPTDRHTALHDAARCLLSRAEAASLLGMVVVMASLFLKWERHTFSVSGALPVSSLYGSPTVEVVLTGNGTAARWPMTICAVLACLTLVFPMSRATRVAVAGVQTAAALVCVVVPLSRLSTLPGVVAGLLGGALLLFGSIDRYLAAECAQAPPIPPPGTYPPE